MVSGNIDIGWNKFRKLAFINRGQVVLALKSNNSLLKHRGKTTAADF